jgi:zinc protease
MKSDLGVLPGGKPERVAKPVPAPIDGRHVVLVDNKSAIGSSISMGAPIDLLRGSKDFYALWIANSWLGEHRNSASHLYQVIREERGLNYGDYSYIEAFPNGGRRSMPPQGVGRRQQMFEVWVRTIKPVENTGFAVRAALREIETLVKDGMAKEDFEFTRNFLKGYSAHFAESTGERLGYAIDDRFYGIDGQGHLAKFRKMMDTVTLEDVNAAVRKYMKTDDLVIAIVTNDAEGVKTALSSGNATPVTYPKDAAKSAEIVAEDKVIESWPLRIDPAHVTVVPVDSMFASSSVRN